MKTVGIVSEFNPFHNGHKYLIDSVRAQLAPDAVVCIMSGNFVQRGGPALTDKWTRARMAVTCGADLVVELPVVYAVSGAPIFAAGGIAIMKGLGLDAVAFGSESGDMFSLEAKLHDGVTPVDMKNSPNDILALEYMKQNRAQNAGLEEFTVQRTGAGHDSMKIGGNTASASMIRKMVQDGAKVSETADFVPCEAVKILESGILLGKEGTDRWFDLVRYCLLSKSPEELAALPAAYGGIEYRLKEAVTSCRTLGELILTAKAKRYAYAGLSRLLTQMVLGITSNMVTKAGITADAAELPAYARVLAFNDAGSAFLKELRKTASIPVITNIGKNLADDAPERALIDIDARASDIYSILIGRQIYANSDFVLHP